MIYIRSYDFPFLSLSLFFSSSPRVREETKLDTAPNNAETIIIKLRNEQLDFSVFHLRACKEGRCSPIRLKGLTSGKLLISRTSRQTERKRRNERDKAKDTEGSSDKQQRYKDTLATRSKAHRPRAELVIKRNVSSPLSFSLACCSKGRAFYTAEAGSGRLKRVQRVKYACTCRQKARGKLETDGRVNKRIHELCGHVSVNMHSHRCRDEKNRAAQTGFASLFRVVSSFCHQTRTCAVDAGEE